MAWLSIIPMTASYPEIWNDFVTPSGVDRQLCIDNICLELGELDLLYDDPDVLSFAIHTWTKRELPIWTELQKTLEYKYNPIANVEADETETRELTGDHTRTPNITSTQSVAGYNESQFAPANKVDNTGKEDYKLNDKETTVRHREGNIGVTMTQQLIQAQRDIVQFSVVSHITDSFKAHFCLMVY